MRLATMRHWRSERHQARGTRVPTELANDARCVVNALGTDLGSQAVEVRTCVVPNASSRRWSWP